LTTGEIADELNISKDTAQWLSMQMTNVSKTKQKQIKAVSPVSQRRPEKNSE